MNAFRFISYLAPLLSGFGVAAALSLTRRLPWRRRVAWAGGTHGGVVVLLFGLSFVESVALFPAVALLLTAFAALVASVFLLVEFLGARREVCQLVSSLVVVALMGSVFLIEPVLENAVRAGLSGPAIGARITWILSVNPFMTTGLSIFGHDLLHVPAFYKLDLAAFQHAPPRWGATSLGYGIAAGVLGGAAAIRRRFST
jgi:hypothetical protein